MLPARSGIPGDPRPLAAILEPGTAQDECSAPCPTGEGVPARPCSVEEEDGVEWEEAEDE